MTRQFVENDSGVHFVMGEYTLCGDALDAPDSESDWTEGEFRETTKKVVSCPRCSAIVLECRGVRVENFFTKDRK